MPVSPELSGGAGFTYEDAVTAWYLAALLSQRPGPGLPGGVVARVDLQRVAVGEPLDDVIITADPASGGGMLGLQVKRSFQVNARPGNSAFRETIERGWRMLVDPDKAGLDIRIGVATGDIDPGELRQTQTVCDWARRSADASDFFRRVAIPNFASDGKRAVVQAVRVALDAGLNRSASDDEVFRFLKAFVLIRLDVLGDAPVDVQTPLDRIAAALRSPSAAEEAGIWRDLRVIVREGAGAAASFDRASLIEALGRAERFAVAPSWREDIARLEADARRALASIEQSIDGLVIPRDGLIARIEEALLSERVVQITGQPGVGKSVLLRAFAQDRDPSTPILVLKADRLVDGGWSGFANQLGLTAHEIVPLLRELAATGDPLLMIDGLDRVGRSRRELVVTVLEAVLGDPSLARWRVVASLRDGGWEYVGRWAPRLRQTPHLRLEVGNLDDAEANLVADRHPRLRELLFGESAVQEIARRPFFLNVLASEIDLEVARPSSETELLEAWWAGGGYDADGADRTRRQRALITLGRSTAGTLGREGPTAPLDADALESLKADQILRDAEPGHTVSFRHDIYFEWAFVHDLIEAGEDWTQRLIDAGEPPALGRPVELLSQRRFEKDQNWREGLDRLETSGGRSQWRRSWVLGPPSSPRFADLHDRYSEGLLIDDDGARLRDLLTWFQAVRTEAADDLSMTPGLADMSEMDRMRLADMLAAPTDYACWGRLMDWLIATGDRIPVGVWPQVLVIMEIWQSVALRHRNGYSSGLLAMAETWLHRLEDHRHPPAGRDAFDAFAGLSHEQERALTRDLRALLARAAVAYPEIAERYLSRLIANRRLEREAWDTLTPLSRYLASAAPDLLAQAFSQAARDVLPREALQREVDDEARRRTEAEAHPEGSWEREMLMPSGLGGWVNSWDWDRLALESLSRLYAPLNPRTEPFDALFEYAPEAALALVKTLADHAIAAWRELNALDPRRGGTPIPLVLDFPWGRETYWGTERHYGAYRGVFGPRVLAAGFKAMESWAFGRLDAGDPLDDVIRSVVSGVSHSGVLGIGVALALERMQGTSVTLPLAASPRIWRWDLHRLITIDARRRSEAGPNARGRWVRQLAPLFALSPDASLQTGFSAAVAAFPANLPFDLEEQRDDPDLVEKLTRDATRWVHLGERSGYDFEETEGGTIIRERPPEQTDPGETIAIEQYEQTGRWIALAEQARVLRADPTAPVPDAVLAEARALDEPTLFSRPLETGDLVALGQGGVAAVAAVVLGKADAGPEDLDWAMDVILRAAETPLPTDGLTAQDSILADHPQLHVPDGLAAMVRRGIGPRDTPSILMGLCAHYLQEVGKAALHALVGLADVEPRIATGALQFVVDMSVRSDGPQLWEEDRRQAHAVRESDLQAAWDRAVAVVMGQAEFTLPTFPLPPAELEGVSDDPFAAIWGEPTYFDTHRLTPLLPFLTQAALDGPLAGPVNALADALLAWTVARAGAIEANGGRANEILSEWRLSLLDWLGALATGEEDTSLDRRFIEPILALPDTLFVAFAGPFIGFYTGVKIFDAPTLTSSTVELLVRFARRASGLRLSRRGGDETEELLIDLMGIPRFNHDGARRFANGDWSDIGLMLPVIEVLFEAFHASKAFVQRWLDLTERAVDHYPAALFAGQLDRAVAALGSEDLTTRQTSRIAGLVQTYAEAEAGLTGEERQAFARALDVLIDSGSRRAAALQRSEVFRGHLRSGRS